MAVTIRKNDIKASNLYLIGLGVSTISLLCYQMPFKPTPHVSQNAFHVTLLLTHLLLIGMGWAIRVGRCWAKVVLLLFTIPGTVLYLMRLPHYLGMPWLQIMLNLLCTALQAWAAVIVARDLLLRRPVATEAEKITF